MNHGWLLNPWSRQCQVSEADDAILLDRALEKAILLFRGQGKVHTLSMKASHLGYQ